MSLAKLLDPPDHLATLEFPNLTGLVENRIRQEIKQSYVKTPLGLHISVIPGKVEV